MFTYPYATRCIHICVCHMEPSTVPNPRVYDDVVWTVQELAQAMKIIEDKKWLPVNEIESRWVKIMNAKIRINEDNIFELADHLDHLIPIEEETYIEIDFIERYDMTLKILVLDIISLETGKIIKTVITREDLQNTLLILVQCEVIQKDYLDKDVINLIQEKTKLNNILDNY